MSRVYIACDNISEAPPLYAYQADSKPNEDRGGGLTDGRIGFSFCFYAIRSRSLNPVISSDNNLHHHHRGRAINVFYSNERVTFAQLISDGKLDSYIFSEGKQVI